MDFLIFKTQGQGVVTTMTEAFKQHDTLVTLNPAKEHSADFGRQVADKIREASGKPLTILIDLSDVDPTPFMRPMYGIVASRVIGGNPLPKQSSIVLVMDELALKTPGAIPSPIESRFVRLDMTTPGFRAAPNTQISQEGLSKLQERIADAILNMASLIQDEQGLTGEFKRRPAEPETPDLS